MLGLTAAQLALLKSPAQQIKGAVAIGTVSPMRYCTGVDPIQITIDEIAYWFTPRMIAFDDIKLDDPVGATTSVVIDDLEGDLRAAWYAERFSGLTANIYLFSRSDDGTWTKIVDLEWLITTALFNKKGQFRINLAGGAGLCPRAGLMTGNRISFMFAPEAGEAMRFGAAGGGITFHPGDPQLPPPPGGVVVIDRPRYGDSGAGSIPLSQITE